VVPAPPPRCARKPPPGSVSPSTKVCARPSSSHAATVVAASHTITQATSRRVVRRVTGPVDPRSVGSGGSGSGSVTYPKVLVVPVGADIAGPRR
jgi:hypothetical protein